MGCDGQNIVIYWLNMSSYCNVKLPAILLQFWCFWLIPDVGVGALRWVYFRKRKSFPPIIRLKGNGLVYKLNVMFEVN